MYDDIPANALMFRHRPDRPTSVSDNGRYAIIAEPHHIGVRMSVYNTDSIPYPLLYTCVVKGNVRGLVAVSCSGVWSVFATMHGDNLNLVRYLYVEGTVKKQSTIVFTNIHDDVISIGISNDGSVWHSGVVVSHTPDVASTRLMCGIIVSTAILTVSIMVGYITFTLGV